MCGVGHRPGVYLVGSCDEALAAAQGRRPDRPDATNGGAVGGFCGGGGGGCCCCFCKKPMMVSRRKDVACRVVAQHIFLGGGGSVWAAFLMNTVITDPVLYCYY